MEGGVQQAHPKLWWTEGNFHDRQRNPHPSHQIPLARFQRKAG